MALVKACSNGSSQVDSSSIAEYLSLMVDTRLADLFIFRAS